MTSIVKAWLWRGAATFALTLACMAWLRPDMLVSVGNALWLCIN